MIVVIVFGDRNPLTNIRNYLLSIAGNRKYILFYFYHSSISFERSHCFSPQKISYYLSFEAETHSYVAGTI